MGVSAGAPAPMVTLRGRPYGSDSRMSEVGSIGINPHRARSLLRDRNLEEPLEISLRAIGFDPRDQMPTTTSSKSIRGSSTIAKSRSFVVVFLWTKIHLSGCDSSNTRAVTLVLFTSRP